MGRGLLGLMVIGLSLAAAAPARAEAKRRYVPLDVTIVPPVNLFHFERKVIIGASVNVIYGRSAAVYGVEVGGIVNRETEGFGGIQVAGVVNWVSGRCLGVQAALVNYCERGGAIQLGLVNGGDRLSGIQLGLLGNHAKTVGFGVQLGLIVNNALKEFRGLQAGLMNFDNQSLPSTVGSCGANCEVQEVTVYPQGETRGIVIGVGNLAQNLRGLQVGLINSAARTLGGIQVGALLNLAGDAAGLQVGPFNVAKDVRGVQLGLVNVARRLKGVQLGAINVAYKNPLPVMVGINAGF